VARALEDVDLAQVRLGLRVRVRVRVRVRSTEEGST